MTKINLKKQWTAIKNNQEKIDSFVNLFGKCIEPIAALSSLQKEPNLANYLNVYFKCKEQYDKIYKKDDSNYFLNQNWQPFGQQENLRLLDKFLRSKYTSYIQSKKIDNSTKNLHILTLKPEIQIGWIQSENSVYTMYVSRNKETEAFQILNNKIWEGTRCLQIEAVRASWEYYSDLTSSSEEIFMIPNFLDLKYFQYVKKYQENNLSRSIVFYGPPGTGKSTLIRSICQKNES